MIELKLDAFKYFLFFIECWSFTEAVRIQHGAEDEPSETNSEFKDPTAGID